MNNIVKVFLELQQQNLGVRVIVVRWPTRRGAVVSFTTLWPLMTLMCYPRYKQMTYSTARYSYTFFIQTEMRYCLRISFIIDLLFKLRKYHCIWT